MWVLSVGEVWERGGLRPGGIRNAACLPLSFCPICPMDGCPLTAPRGSEKQCLLAHLPLSGNVLHGF